MLTEHEALEVVAGTRIPWSSMIDRKIRKDIVALAANRPSLQSFLDEARKLHPVITEAIAGIYTGADGRVSEVLNTGNPRISRRITFGWHDGKIEFCYLG